MRGWLLALAALAAAGGGALLSYGAPPASMPAEQAGSWLVMPPLATEQAAAGIIEAIADGLGGFFTLLLVLWMARLPGLRETVQPLRDELNAAARAWLPRGEGMDAPGWLAGIWRALLARLARRKDAALERKGYVRAAPGAEGGEARPAAAPPPAKAALTPSQASALAAMAWTNTVRTSVLILCVTAIIVAVLAR